VRDTTLKNSLMALCFVLFSTVAQAAKLGDITILSSQGQPLNAEIVLIPASEEDLSGITARVAAAEVFAEQGLTMSPEIAAVHAVVAIRADGKSVVQLFSTEPINVSALDLLIQVDSSTGGSLVRKYAFALEAPPAAAAPEQVALPEAMESVVEEAGMAIEEAMTEAMMADETILEQVQEEVMEEREATIEEMTADVTGIEAPEDEPSPFDENADLAIDDMQAQDMTDALPEEPVEMVAEMADDGMTTDDMQAQDMTEIEALEEAQAEEIAETELVTEDFGSMTAEIYNPENPVDSPAAPASSSNYTVESGDTLRKIATQQWYEDVSLEQMMAGIYGANPLAFAKGDPNRLKVGTILRMPSADELKNIDQAEAHNVVHANNWNAYRSRLADTVAKAAPVSENESSSVASGKIATVRDQAEAMHGSRDVVKLSGGAGAGMGGKMSKAEMEEELVARENALKESNERIALLEKQLSDANALLEAQKKAMEAARATESSAPLDKEQAKPKAGMMATLQENLQKHPDWKAKALGALAILIALVLILRNRRKGDIPKKPDAPTAETSGAALTELSKEAAAEKVAADIAAGAAIAAAALAAQAASQPEAPVEPSETSPQVSDDEVLSVADLDALLTDDEPAAVEKTMAEAMAEQMEQPVQQEATADELVADMMAASDAVQVPEPVAEEVVANSDNFDDVFESETALAEMVAELPETTEPAVIDEIADEAATDMMAAAAMENGSVEADDQFSMDDVFAEAVPEAPLAELVVETPLAQTMLEISPADGDHSEALAAAFEETAKEDLSGLDFDFVVEMPAEAVVAAPTAITKAKKTAKPRAKKAAVEPEVKLDLSGIDLDVSSEGAAVDSAEVETKLDLVSAYMDMGDEDGAREILQEVIKEGSAAQISKAQKLLDSLG